MNGLYANPETVFRPGIRWWMAQGYHTDQTLTEESKLLYDSGFGDFEALASGDGTVTPASRYAWGSPEWNNDMQLLLREATKNKIGISLTSGTNWGNANLPNTFTVDGQPMGPDNPAAMQVLSYGQMNLAPGASIAGALPAPGVAPAATVNVTARKKYFVGAVAARVTDATTNPITLSASDVIDLSDQVQGDGDNRTLNWTNSTSSPYVILTFWQHGSALTASPSYATNYVVNYVDKLGVEAVKEYWDHNIFTPAMQNVIDENGRVQFYMDSLEIAQGTSNGGTMWGFDFANTFKSDRGYSVIKYLPFLIYNKSNSFSSTKTDRFRVAPADAALVRRVQNDMYQIKTKTYQENVLEPLREWLHGHDMTLRAEPSYGQLFEASTPAKYLDGVETETLEFNTNMDSNRELAGGAHLFGKPFSSETGAVSGGGLYRNTQDFYNQLVFQQFAVGVQRIMFHTYSSKWGTNGATVWPGYTPSTAWSDRFGSRQPWFGQSDEWSKMITRYQKVLRQGAPRVDLGILRIDYDMNGRLGEEGYTANSTLPTIRHHEGVYWRDFSLQKAGYTYEYTAPMNLTDPAVTYDPAKGVVSPNGPSYKALLIYQDVLPLDSAKKLLEWAKQGLPVVFANDTEEMAPNVSATLNANSFALKYPKAASQTPYNDGGDAELASVIAQIKALPNVRDLNPDQAGVRLGAGSSESKAPAALKALGVTPRAEFVTPNTEFITNTRDAGDKTYLYVYNYMYDAKKHLSNLWGVSRPQPDTQPFTTAISIEGVGRPYFFDARTGTTTPAPTYSVANGHTSVDVTVSPGEATVVVLDKTDPGSAVHAVSTTADDVVYKGSDMYVKASNSGTYQTVLSDGKTATTSVVGRDDVDLPQWNLQLESWEPGDRLTRIENRDASFPGGPYTTTEYTVETVKRNIDIGQTALVPWRSLPGLTGADRITGVGTYTTTVTLPADWSADRDGAYLAIGSINQGTAVVYVNGQKAPGAVDAVDPRKDVSDLLHAGANTIRVEVAAADLGNRYYAPTTQLPAQDYGMTGATKLVTYTIAKARGETSTGGTVGGTVPATLSLSLGTPASFGAFTPGVDRNYDASTTATVVSTAGDATLSVTDPSSNATGRLVNGSFATSEPLQARAGSAAFAPLSTTAGSPLAILTYAGPVSNDAVTVGFRQHIASNQALRTGSYSKTLTFTLSTTTP